MKFDVKRISSLRTVIAKRIFPVLWSSVTVMGALIAFGEGALESRPALVFGPVVMGVCGLLLWWLLASDLADEVLDCGDHLLVRRGGIQDRVFFSDIADVETSSSVSPSRIILCLVMPTKVGTRVAFTPAAANSLNPFVKNRLAEELAHRAREARSRHAG